MQLASGDHNEFGFQLYRHITKLMVRPEAICSDEKQESLYMEFSKSLVFQQENRGTILCDFRNRNNICIREIL